MTLANTTDNERIAVNLKMLVDLARPAAALHWQPTRIKAGQNGNYLSHFKGRGMAFAETRLYQPGDDVRRMDWRVTARTGKPHSKIFQEEREQPLFISVDYRPTMRFATRGVFKSVQAAKLAGLLAWAAQQRGDRIGGQILTATGCMELKPRTGKSALLRFFHALVHPETARSEGNTLEHAMSRLQHHARPGSRVFIISDFRGLNAATENHLALLSRHCEIVLLHVYDPLESRLPDKGRYRFTDTIRDIVIDGADKKTLYDYQRHFEDRRSHLKQLSQKLKLGLCACSTQQSPLDVLAAMPWSMRR